MLKESILYTVRHIDRLFDEYRNLGYKARYINKKANLRLCKLNGWVI